MFVSSILGDFNPTSIGSTASNLRVVLYAHNTSGRYSTHFPFRSSNLVYSDALRILIVTSACSLTMDELGMSSSS